MDFVTIIIGLISLALFIVPIMYISRKQKQVAGKAMQEFLALAGQQELSLTKYDFWNQRFALGLDEKQHKLFYFCKQADKEQVLLLDLADVKSCELVKDSREVNDNKIIDLIALRLSFRAAKPQLLVFYQKEDNMLLGGELQLATKWSAIISEALKNNANKQVA
ncbi:hypothetical protein [uncultured Pontibacter sp.]|uniref:hypothetical protein n=1 Tax=uncultured Pontibacter sp. TaxID=453356 RepID=UPI00262162B9|nr:hypothetical protein [uncultured Pontibacter sp.]